MIAGPSGVGKGTIVRRLLAEHPELWWSVSVTDRAPRPGEAPGHDYEFVTREEFEDLRDAGGLLEWFEVYGDLKGTPRTPVEAKLAVGRDVLVEVDVQGALAIREQIPDAFLVFVRAPSPEEQRARLVGRDPEADPAALGARLAAAAREEALADRFDAVIVNDDVGRAVAEIGALLEARRRDGPGRVGSAP